MASELDISDKHILSLLQRNAKLTTKEIAAKVNLTTTPVFERIRRLENQGIISKYVALTNKEKLGKAFVSFCNVSLKEHSHDFLKQFEKDVLALDQVMEVYHIAGMYDYLLKVVVSDIGAYQEFIINSLATLDNIGQVQSSFVMKEIKYSTEIKL